MLIARDWQDSSLHVGLEEAEIVDGDGLQKVSEDGIELRGVRGHGSTRSGAADKDRIGCQQASRWEWVEGRKART
jgi:hypothetical protein